MKSAPLRILVVGQTPPPPHGQSAMIAQLLAQEFDGVALRHVRMAFSQSIEEIGAPSLRKALHLVSVIARILVQRIVWRPHALYYPPAGASRTPILRDIAILVAVRWMFRATIFHFHACGVSAQRDRLPRWLRLWFDLAYRRPDLALHVSDGYPPDGAALGARLNRVVPNGIPDHATPPAPRAPIPILLNVGIQSDEKGTPVLLDACERLRARGRAFRLVLAGRAHPADFAQRLRDEIRERGLESCVEWRGEVTGEARAALYAGSDVFCFPSRHPTESFGLVLVEAMQFGLPVVAARHRAAPGILGEQEAGLLLESWDPSEWADAISRLLDSPDLRRELGAAGRRRYEAQFTVAAWRDGMQRAFDALRSTLD